MMVWIGIRKGVLVFHLFNRHLTFFGGFRDNYGDWHDDVGEPVFCKCGTEI